MTGHRPVATKLPLWHLTPCHSVGVAPPSFTALTHLAFARWISDDDASWSYVLHRHCSCTNNCSLANCDAWAHERIRTNPGVGANHNWRTQQRKIRLGVTVCSRAKMRAMRHCDARA